MLVPLLYWSQQSLDYQGRQLVRPILGIKLFVTCWDYYAFVNSHIISLNRPFIGMHKYSALSSFSYFLGGSMMRLLLGRSTARRSWSTSRQRLKMAITIFQNIYSFIAHLLFSDVILWMQCDTSKNPNEPFQQIFVHSRCMIHEVLFCQHMDIMVLSCLLLTTWNLINFSNITLLQCLFWRLHFFLYLRCYKQCNFMNHSTVGTGIVNVFNRSCWHPWVVSL